MDRSHFDAKRALQWERTDDRDVEVFFRSGGEVAPRRGGEPRVKRPYARAKLEPRTAGMVYLCVAAVAAASLCCWGSTSDG